MQISFLRWIDAGKTLLSAIIFVIFILLGQGQPDEQQPGEGLFDEACLYPSSFYYRHFSAKPAFFSQLFDQ